MSIWTRWFKPATRTSKGAHRSSRKTRDRKRHSPRLTIEHLEERVVPANYTWTNLNATAANWNAATVPTNWSPNTAFPNAAADSANMNVNITSNQTVTLGQNITINSLTIGDGRRDRGRHPQQHWWHPDGA